MQDSDALRRGIAEVYLRNTNAPHLQSSSPGLTGRPSIPETPVMESRSRGVMDTPLEPVIGLAEGETRWRGMTTVGGGAHASRHCPRQRRSVCARERRDEAIQLFRGQAWIASRACHRAARCADPVARNDGLTR